MSRLDSYRESLGYWSENNLDMLWDFLNGRDLNYWVTWSGIYYSFVFLVGLALLMVMLKPRASIERGLTWLMISFAFVLFRVLYTRIVNAVPLFWSTLIWLNLSVSITYTGYALLTDKMIRRRALGSLPWGSKRPT